MSRIEHTLCRILLAIGTLVPMLATAQFQNTWIDYDQKYLKFPITEDGIYRISRSTLENAVGVGIVDLDTLDSRRLQIFGRGKEIPIHVQDNNGNYRLDASDFIEFYAQMNDGWLDSAIYEDPNGHPNPFYSNFTNTANYYLTWTTEPGAINNNRFTAVTSQNLNAYTPLPFVWREEVEVYPDRYYLGFLDNNDKSNPPYTLSEGWFSNRIGYLNSWTQEIASEFPYTVSGAPAATLRTVVAGANRGEGNPNHRCVMRVGTASNLNLVWDQVFEAYTQLEPEILIPANEVGQNAGATTLVKYENGVVTPTPSASDYAVGFLYLKYARQPNFGGANEFEFIIPASGQASRIDISNFTTNQTTHVYDLTTNNRVSVVQASSTFQALIPGGGGVEKRCYVASQSAIDEVTGLELINGNGDFVNYATILPDSAYLILSHPQIWSSAQQYASYRQSTGYNVVLIDVNELYDQFGYGIAKHPWAIRGFCDYAIATAPSLPKHMFLLGKSVYEKNTRHNATQDGYNLVPTFGFPPSDNMYTAGLNGTSLDAAIPTGRLAAFENAQVLDYLNKVQEFESAQNSPEQTIEQKAWMKRVLHFGGGADANEQSLFRGYLSHYTDTITSDKFGGVVFSFYKDVTDPIQINLSDSVETLMNQGASLLTFFGHASGSSFDISIGLPENYQNTDGKYPMILANSCNAGDIHTPVAGAGTSTSESFVLHERGSIGFISSTSLGFATRLHAYTLKLYSNIGRQMYGRTIGECMVRSMQQLEQQFSTGDMVTEATILEMGLHGDPALRIHPHALPDYAIREVDVFFEPEEVSTDLTTFDLKVDITNIGQALDSTIEVEIIRTWPNGVDSIHYVTMPGIFYKDTLTLTLPVGGVNGSGLNAFQVRVDHLDLINEMTNANNNVALPSKDLWISSDDLLPIYPYDYSVVPDQNVSLAGSTADLFSQERSYVLQIDTTDFFNSPAFLETTISTQGGVVRWSPGSSYFNFPDSTVFFWRTSPVPDNGVDYLWREQSFQYIDEQHGWGQDHFFQFDHNQYTFIDNDRNTRTFDFEPAAKGLEVVTYGNPVDNDGIEGTEYSLNGIKQEYGICNAAPCMFIAVIDPLTLDPWGTRKPLANGQFNNPDNYFGNYNDLNVDCRDREEHYFRFLANDPVQFQAMADMVTNSVPDSAWIVAFSGIRANFDDSTLWTDAVFSAFENLGADSIRTVPGNYPYIFVAKKGAPGTAQEVIGTSSIDVISLLTEVSNSGASGNIMSTVVGPAYDWNSLHWRNRAQENPTTDSLRVDVLGMTSINDPGALQGSLLYPLNDVMQLDTMVSATDYPYLRLRWYTDDDQTLTPSQLQRWQVLHDGVPEAAINPQLGFYLSSDSISQGETVNLCLAVENVSDIDMDSLRVRYWIEDQYRTITEVEYPTQAPLLAGGVLKDTVSVPTAGLSGPYSLWMEVNPQDSLWQLEQHHFNNLARVSFFAQPDRTNPLLDVTFDGIHILDGDIVSPSPEIVITLDDENEFLALNDTVGYKVYLTEPTGNQYRVWFMHQGQEVLRFIPASLPKNQARIEYNPDFLADGVYKLQVYAQDASGNAAGDLDYTISFEVVSRSTITQVLNYPNPFSTSTRFVFTLTGAEVPDYFRIQILTVTGKVVREIDADELGPLRIGRNITEFAWDGTDTYGDPLANGVYLYRVITQINREDIELRSTEADRFFHRGFGKMYLMR